MGWITVTHRCDLPDLAEVTAKKANTGSTWTCEVCLATWTLDVGNQYVPATWTKKDGSVVRVIGTIPEVYIHDVLGPTEPVQPTPVIPSKSTIKQTSQDL